FVHFQVLFAGTLLDIFIITVSLSLAGKVQVVGKRMQKISASKIDRLISQITRDTMALSGMNFFYLRRNIIAGSIVTYELVLMEFAGSFLKEGQVTNRTSTL
ncbi:unnamed protein product, partial [Diabrotica balteata]